MAESSLTLGPISVTVPAGWTEITDELDLPNAPHTLAHGAGEGALQFSVAAYTGGKQPRTTARELREMSLNLGESESLGKPEDVVFEDGPPLLGAAGFRTDGHVIRIWHVSDGWSFACVTYTGPASGYEQELADCERIVRTIRFPGTRPAGPAPGAGA